MTVFVIESWMDERLEFEGKGNLHLSGLDIYRIWMPDLFFPYETNARLHDVTVPNLRAVLSENGQVKLVLRYVSADVTNRTGIRGRIVTVSMPR